MSSNFFLKKCPDVREKKEKIKKAHAKKAIPNGKKWNKEKSNIIEQKITLNYRIRSRRESYIKKEQTSIKK